MYKDSHYAWLEKNLPDFFRAAGIPWEGHEGIIVAHGDKCYGYKDKWEAAGIEFAKGVAIYLLSYCGPYSKECREIVDGDNRKWVDPGQWVIDNKDRFLPLL